MSQITAVAGACGSVWLSITRLGQSVAGFGTHSKAEENKLAGTILPSRLSKCGRNRNDIAIALEIPR